MNQITSEILKLKKEKNAIILAHYYVPAEAQSLADYVGDSYYLAKVAQETDADIVVFCGVSFMGESVKILNPEKKVLMPDMNADCPMAHMADVHTIQKLREQYEDLAVVCYINSTAELKCYSDVCVTSSNAIKIVSMLPNEHIFFIPDENLGRYVASQVPEKHIILNEGCCPIHASLGADDVTRAKGTHPNALVLAHPECREEVLSLADYIGSTSEIITFAQKSDKQEFIICTEEGVSCALTKRCPDKKFFFPCKPFQCFDMKQNTPENILRVLKSEENQVVVDERTRISATIPLKKMLEIVR